MLSYSATDIFSTTECDIFTRATLIVQVMPNPSRGEPELRCHEVARIVGRLLNLPVVDGYYGSVDHSWCVIGDATAPVWARKGVILDVYAVGRLPMVQLVTGGCIGLPNNYYPGPPRNDVRSEDCRLPGEKKGGFEVRVLGTTFCLGVF